jgi:hypothetical protein
MKQLLVYERPVVLNRERHRGLKIRPRLESFAFARDINSAPLVASEFSPAARDYPIVFAGDEPAAMLPAALLGLNQDENLFVGDDGRWAGQVHVPAFLRRYPFVVADQAESEEDFTVCIDEAVIDDGDDAVALFDDHGRDTPVLEHAIRFLSEYQADVQRTRSFVEQLVHHKLLVEKTVKVERSGSQTQTLRGFSVVDEERLQNLGAKSLQKLSRSGALGLAYVHLMSLGNVQRLSARLDAKRMHVDALH